MNRIGSLAWALLAAALLAAAARENRTTRAMRRDLHLTQADPLINAPPLVALTTVAMGGFRGIAADLLWLRASRLQEEGRYFELVQLADWITKLEPRFTTVWAFQAWNLAYNISVLFNQPEDRWRWVRNGLTLLRDEGLIYNPGDARLLYELGWIFQHKIGGSTDQMHLYYKKQWAAEMGRLFEGPCPSFDRVRADPELRRRFEADYKLDVSLMEQVENDYGPLDWRLPQAHALYWAVRSRAIATGFDAVSADRMIYQCMADALQQGRLFERPDENVFIPSPNLDLLPRVRKSFADALAREPNQDSFKVAHRNFLTGSIVMLFAYHRLQEARSMFDELQRLYPDAARGLDFETFVVRAYVADAQNLSDRDALAMVEGTLSQSLFWRAMGDADRAAGYESLARLTWDNYMKVRTTEEFRERTGLPPLDEIRKIAWERLQEQLPNSEAVRRLASPGQ